MPSLFDILKLAKNRSQTQVREIDNKQVDAWGRTEMGPDAEWFRDTRSTGHARGQQIIDHLSARARGAAELLKAGNILAGSAYEDAPSDYDYLFGPGSFHEHFLSKP